MADLMIVPTKLLELNVVSHQAKVLYLHMLSFAYDNVTCYPSLETLAKRMACSDRTIMRYSDELRKYGLIKYVRGYNRQSSRYVLIPMEWVEEKEVPEEEQDLTPTEFERLTKKIKKFYEEQGKKLTTKNKSKTSRVVMTREALIGKLKEDLKNPDYKLTQGDYAYYFAWKLQEIRGELYDPKSAKDKGRSDFIALKQMFIDNNLSQELNLKIIEVYIATFKELHESEKFPRPYVKLLRPAFVFNQIKRLAEEQLRIEAELNTDEDIIEEEF